MKDADMGSSKAMTNNPDFSTRLKAIARERIVILDGAMGTMIQAYGLGEADYRGTLYADHLHDLKGNNDILCLTAPHIMDEIHEGFLAAGADIIETNSFNGTSISQADYGMEHAVVDLNLAAAGIARAAADRWTAKTPEQPRFVAGAIGPTNKTLSVSPRVNEPGHRDVTFDQMAAVYFEQAQALVEGGVDFLLIETIFDTLNAKAALVAVDRLSRERGVPVPVIVSVTVTDLSGRNLSGQTVDAFWYSVRHANPLAVGLNCSFGADQLRPYVQVLAKCADTLVLVYPNAGLPNDMGAYDELPAHTAASLESFAKDGFVNIVGGCCGTTPDHIKAIVTAMKGKAPRTIPELPRRLYLAGLETMAI